MKKQYKLLNKNGTIYLLRWAVKGGLFGPRWESLACFDNRNGNIERRKTIVRLMNECDKHTNSQEYDRE